MKMDHSLKNNGARSQNREGKLIQYKRFTLSTNPNQLCVI